MSQGGPAPESSGAKEYGSWGPAVGHEVRRLLEPPQKATVMRTALRDKGTQLSKGTTGHRATVTPDPYLIITQPSKFEFQINDGYVF
jgi:hypothetical protein